MENETGAEIRERRKERLIFSGCFQSILALVVIIILWIVMIGGLTLLAKICWEVIKYVWRLW